jgi:hypothetical protein
MNAASYEAIDACEGIWIVLARWYPPDHFDFLSPDRYIRDFIANRFVWHRAVNQPHGEGQAAGSMLGQVVGGAVLGDLEDMIAETAEALIIWNDLLDEIDIEDWRSRWAAAGVRADA